MRGEHAVGSKRLTWVAGDRPEEALDDVSRKNLAAQPESGTSIFDPVLCELVYRWFCPPAGTILDPFAGGSVRGIVASKLGRHYVGIELSERQIAENMQQAKAICKKPLPRYITGDAREIAAMGIEPVDLIFSCPPYGDLERYSDDPRDLSTMAYPAYVEGLRAVVGASVALLKPDRFACFVVANVRGEKGFYNRLVSDTEQAFEDAGARLHNEAVLVTAVGSLPIRAGRQFESGRKLGKTHQNVLVFCKGDAGKATKAIGAVEFGEVL